MTRRDWVIGSVLAVAIVAAGFMLRCTTKLTPDECVPNWPRVVVDGKMYTHGFDIPYQLGYEGAFEVSGAPCTAWRRVLQSEYERRMYGSE